MQVPVLPVVRRRLERDPGASHGVAGVADREHHALAGAVLSHLVGEACTVRPAKTWVCHRVPPAFTTRSPRPIVPSIAREYAAPPRGIPAFWTLPTVSPVSFVRTARTCGRRFAHATHSRPWGPGEIAIVVAYLLYRMFAVSVVPTCQIRTLRQVGAPTQ